MATNWLLVETFGGSSAPSIIGLGATPKGMVPLKSILARGRNLEAVEAAIEQVRANGKQCDFVARDQSKHVIAHPLTAFSGRVHGVYVWVGPVGQEPPTRDPAGAWHFNLTTDHIGGSSDLLDLYGVAPENRKTERATAEAFERLIPNADASAALALLVRSRPGDEHQAVWAIRRDDGEMRAGHLSCRAVAEEHEGQVQVVLRGITQDIGPAEETPAAPPPAVLEQRVLESMAEPGTHRAVVNLKTLRILRWLDEPLPDLKWRHDPLDTDHTTWIHPEDQGAADALSTALSTGRTTGTLRLASVDGGWLSVDIVANILLLDQHTTAGLFSMRRTSPDPVL